VKTTEEKKERKIERERGRSERDKARKEERCNIMFKQHCVAYL
jgi:hypothetical protein